MKELRIKLDIYAQMKDGDTQDEIYKIITDLLDSKDLAYQIYETEEQEV